jgi:HlyD family secretion protein
MRNRVRGYDLTVAILLVAGIVLSSASCNRTLPPTAEAAAPPSGAEAKASERREIRITGLVQAVHSVKIMVPLITGQFAQMTLTKLIPNGSAVKEHDLIAAFDATQQVDAARDAKAKYEDLGHQVDQKAAENRAATEKRTLDLRQAEGDLSKAELELQKGPVLSEIDRLQNEAKAAGARKQVASLKKSMAFRDKAEAAALRVLELQRDRQKIQMERTQSNIEKMEIHSPLNGMVVHEMTRRGNSLGHAQEGDLMYRGFPLVSIFDPSEMEVRCSVNEPDLLALLQGATATVTLDAYPDLTIPAHFVSVSPVATAAPDTPVKSFVAVFSIDKRDAHLLPDLSAAVVLERK